MRRLLLLLPTLCLVGCGSDLNPGAAAALPPQETNRVAHRGLLTPEGSTPLQFDLELDRTGGPLTGSARLIAADGRSAAYGPVTGTETGDTLTFDVDLRPQFSLLRLQGASSPQGLNGNFTEQAPGELSLGRGTYQTREVTLAPPLQGRYTATLDDGTVVPLNIGPAGIAPTDFPDVNLPPNPFLVYSLPYDNNELTLGGGLASAYFFNVNDNGAGYPFSTCFFNGDAAGGTYVAISQNNSKQGRFTLTSP